MQLTKAEEKIMQILWSIGQGTVQDILARFEGQKPARTTVGTMLSILENKKFAEHATVGRSNIYRPIVAKEDYSKKQLFGFIRDYFDGSFSSMASFFVQKSDMTVEELDRILEETKQSLKEEQNIE